MPALIALTLAYVLSQFYRAFLAVLTPALERDIGATAENLAQASGVWFLAFALAQLPVGWALDRVGPRLTASVLLTVGAAGAALFAVADSPAMLNPAMALIGLGCAPVLMAAYVILARRYSPAVFGTLAGAIIGFGSIGNIAAALPLTLAAEALGWRGAMWALAGITLAVAATVAIVVREGAPPRSDTRGSLLDLVRMPALWPVLLMMAVCYAPSAGLRGLWIAPYLTGPVGAEPGFVGTATMVMALAMIAGSFSYGPAERLLGTRKWLIFGGNLIVLLLILLLRAMPVPGEWAAVAIFAAIGFFGASFAMVMAHGRAFVPPHLMGRGITLLNLFGIGSAGLLQMVTGRLYAATPADPPSAPFAAVFGAIALLLACGLTAYLFSRDRTD